VNTYIALFRGINVGGKNILSMKDLVAILESIGYKDVRTYIQSGNAVFASQKKLGDKEAAGIRKEILRRVGFEPKLLLLSVERFRKAIENNPFATHDGKALHFYFLESYPEQPDIGRLESLKIASEEFMLSESVFYLYAPEGVGRSKLAAAVEKSVGVPATARNWNTVSKLATLAETI
jgi:uncharacterized protein (DUF1697 family)